MATRCGITTVGALRTILSNLPDEYLIGTNRVGNLSLYEPGPDYLQIGHVELTNIDFLDFDEYPVPEANHSFYEVDNDH